jgi:hypothetical protein
MPLSIGIDLAPGQLGYGRYMECRLQEIPHGAQGCPCFLRTASTIC